MHIYDKNANYELDAQAFHGLTKENASNDASKGLLMAHWKFPGSKEIDGGHEGWNLEINLTFKFDGFDNYLRGEEVFYLTLMTGMGK